jgi:hypothetical protein
MNFKQTTLCAAFAVAMAFGIITTSAVALVGYPSAHLLISGTIYSTTNNDSTNMGVPIKLLSYNNQTLFGLLNSSPSASNEIFIVTGKTRIPAGSFILWNPYEGSLTISNVDGLSFPLDGDGYDFGYLDVDYYDIIGTYSIENFAWPSGPAAAVPTFAGTETDSTGIYFYFDDGNENENEIELYGTATLNWTYGPASDGSQLATWNVTMAGCGNADSYIDGFDAIPETFSATGSGSGIEPTSDVPFFYEDD